MSCTKFIIMKVKLGKHPLFYCMYVWCKVLCKEYVLLCYPKNMKIKKTKQKNIKRKKELGWTEVSVFLYAQKYLYQIKFIETAYSVRAGGGEDVAVFFTAQNDSKMKSQNL